MTRDKTKLRAQKARYYARHRDRILLQRALDVHFMKQMALDALGGKCACCGEGTFEFLAIDHIHGGGNQERKRVGNGRQFYAFLHRVGYPRGRYRILCHNCNLSLGFHGFCPHSTLVSHVL